MRRVANKQCYYCAKRLTRKNYSVDHVIPLSRGGADKWYNKVDACTKCNTEKGCLTADEFRCVLAFRAKVLPKVTFKFYGEGKGDA